jgi:ADP-ribosyl-[dinitrogen reductase] hydrolase
MPQAVRFPAIEGCLLGGAVGDALGLPREGLSPQRAEALFGGPPMRHRLVLGRGMISDDTEHALLAAQAVLGSGGDPKRFARSLAWGLRGWLLGVPAGAGMATARACVRLWFGVPPSRSGVRSAGNGPAMRAAIIGATYADDLTAALDLVDASSRMTHADPRATEGARLVMLASATATLGTSDFFQRSRDLLGDASDWKSILDTIETRLSDGWSSQDYAQSISGKKGPSGFVLESVSVALFCWLRHRGDFRATVESAIALGGDADTISAIAGGIAGAEATVAGIPEDWVSGLAEWPRTTAFMSRVAKRLAEGDHRPVPWFWPGVLPRNAVFLLIVLAHAAYRGVNPRGRRG